MERIGKRQAQVSLSERELLSMEELSALLGRPVKTLQHWRAQKIGPKGMRIGSRVIYRRKDVDAWIEETFNGEPWNRQYVA